MVWNVLVTRCCDDKRGPRLLMASNFEPNFDVTLREARVQVHIPRTVPVPVHRPRPNPCTNYTKREKVIKSHMEELQLILNNLEQGNGNQVLEEARASANGQIYQQNGLDEETVTIYQRAINKSVDACIASLPHLRSANNADRIRGFLNVVAGLSAGVAITSGPGAVPLLITSLVCSISSRVIGVFCTTAQPQTPTVADVVLAHFEADMQADMTTATQHATESVQTLQRFSQMPELNQDERGEIELFRPEIDAALNRYYRRIINGLDEANDPEKARNTANFLACYCQLAHLNVMRLCLQADVYCRFNISIPMATVRLNWALNQQERDLEIFGFLFDRPEESNSSRVFKRRLVWSQVRGLLNPSDRALMESYFGRQFPGDLCRIYNPDSNYFMSFRYGGHKADHQVGRCEEFDVGREAAFLFVRFGCGNPWTGIIWTINGCGYIYTRTRDPFFYRPIHSRSDIGNSTAVANINQASWRLELHGGHFLLPNERFPEYAYASSYRLYSKPHDKLKGKGLWKIDSV